MKKRNLFFAFAAALALSAWSMAKPALAVCTGQFPAGWVCANSGGSQVVPSPQPLTSILDRNFGAPSAQGSLLYRGASAWLALPPGTSGQFLKTQGAGSNPIWASGGGGGSGITALTGDVTASGSGSVAATLATVNSGSGSVGSSTAIPVLTTNSKGLVTAQTTAVVIAPAGTLSGSTLASGVTASSLTSFGNAPTIASPAITGTPTGAGSIITVNSTNCPLAGSCTISLGSLTAGTTVVNGGPGVLSNASSGGFLVSSTTLPSGLAATNLTLITPTLGVATGTSLTLNVPLNLANGGTNNGLTASAGGLVWSDASKLNILAGTVTAGQCLLSGSSATPTWGSCTGSAAVSSIVNSDGTLTISPTTGSVVASLALGHANTWTAAQTFTDGDMLLKGSSSGSMTLKAPAIASTYVVTFPATTDTVAVLGTAQTFTAAKTFTNSDLLLLGSSTGTTTFTSLNASANNYTLSTPAVTSTVAVLGLAQTFTSAQAFSSTIAANAGINVAGGDITQISTNAYIAARASLSTQLTSVGAQASDYLSLPSYTVTTLQQYGSTASGTTAGISNAGLGALYFQNVVSIYIGGNNTGVPIHTDYPWKFSNTTASTSATTGALIVAGGVGVAGALNVGGSISAGVPNSNAIAGDLSVARSSTTGVIFFGSGSGDHHLYYTGALLQIYGMTTGISDTTASTSSTTGALTVAGGVGIGGSLYVGSNINLTASSGSATFSAAEIGSTSTSNTPFIDWHSSGNNIDYDVRLIATGGTASVGAGTLDFYGNQFFVHGGLTVGSTFTATGLVTNADLANAATTVNGQTCTLGSTCTVGAQWFNVNNYASLAAALTAASGKGFVYIPGGTTVSISSAVTCPQNTGIRGDGASSLISVTTASSNGINVPNANCLLFDFAITYTSQGTSTGAAVYITNNNGDAAPPIINNVLINNPYVGLFFSGVNGGVASNTTIVNPTYAGVEFASASNIELTNVNSISSPTATYTSEASLYFTGTSSGVHVTGGEWYGASGYALYIAASSVGNLITNAYFDSSSLGSLVNSTSFLSLIGDWFSAGRTGGGYPGLAIGSSDSVTVQGSQFFNNGAAGLQIKVGSTRTLVNGNTSSGNGITAPGNSFGYFVEAGTTDFNISNNSAGSNSFGIYVGTGAANRYTITNNLVGGNTVGVADGGSGASKTVTGNW
jgi:hypothetical protein